MRNPGELFQVRRPPSPGATKVWVPFTRRDYDALRRDTSVFTDAFAMLPGVETRVDGRMTSGTLVTGNFFQTLGVNAARGRTMIPIDDERFAGRPVIVLSHRGWTRLFAEDPTAIGRRVLVNGAPYEIVGVMPPGFRGLATSPPDYWAPFDLLSQFRHALAGKEDDVAIEVVGRLKPGVSPEAATAGLTVWASGNAAMQASNESTRAAMLRAVTGDASVAGVAASWPAGIGGSLAEATGSTQAPVEYKFVSPEYFSLFDINLVKGRVFTEAERSAGAGIVVVSETTARRLWPDRDAVGQVVQLDAYQPRGALGLNASASTPRLPLRSFTVAGVVRDVRLGLGMFEMVDASVYLPIDAGSAATSLFLRVHGDPDQARQGLIDRLTRVDPAMGAITTMRTIAGRASYVLQVAFCLTAVLAGLALILTVSGLFSVLSYVVEQRSKEIGVRMALGATTQKVAWLVLSQSLRPVGVGLAAGAFLAATVATVLLSTPAASRIGSIVHVFDPVAYAASLLCIVTACVLAASIPALRAARIDPIATLRQE